MIRMILRNIVIICYNLFVYIYELYFDFDRTYLSEVADLKSAKTEMNTLLVCQREEQEALQQVFVTGNFLNEAM